MIRSTTILGVRSEKGIAMGGDGQVTFGETVMKQQASKVRKIHDGKVMAGFAGSTADAFALLDRFEGKMKEFNGNLLKASVELGKEWRTDKYLRNLEALLAVMDEQTSLIISGKGDIVEPDDGIVAVGSGSSYALAAARALARFTKLAPEKIVEEALKITADICIYTNHQIHIETL